MFYIRILSNSSVIGTKLQSSFRENKEIPSIVCTSLTVVIYTVHVNSRLSYMCRMCFQPNRPLLLLLFQLLIGFECGIVVLWDLKSKKADYRYNYDEVRHYSLYSQFLLGYHRVCSWFSHCCIRNTFSLVKLCNQFYHVRPQTLSSILLLSGPV